MIDGLQRLAIDYYFEEEIETILGRINKSIAESDGVYDDNDLYYVSLRFCLLRQNGYHPSAEGEIILDEASAFASKHLNDVLKHVGEDEARVIRDTLNHPYKL
ncbi:hypothetical protein GIB67_028731 [Kingdonia uniflora]|uniref:Terpene synthase N-terminal domain-containing protein n=1 Tax=Kingdonia uniflora TaxID=39325 RepID=A0A7J7NA53_9MAGN|nr:hypothetical protein GIB67_028731 [Kingdonia uniflora]